jgi:hypothetical protein
MRNPWRNVNTCAQPPLFGLPALAVTFQALVDQEAHSVVFGVQTVDPITDTLNALWVSSPVDLDRYLKACREAHNEFLKQLYEAAGPFA